MRGTLSRHIAERAFEQPSSRKIYLITEGKKWALMAFREESFVLALF